MLMKVREALQFIRPVKCDEEKFQVVRLVNNVTSVLPEDQINVCRLESFTELQ